MTQHSKVRTLPSQDEAGTPSTSTQGSLGATKSESSTSDAVGKVIGGVGLEISVRLLWDIMRVLYMRNTE